ncbi:MAG: OmpH family outer membrane protein [Deltaproteobacteria bacterium]|nr:OmpH family outer membrane protein [Deltaproteobacteria bacterium]
MERQVLDVRKKLCLVVILILTIGLGMTLATTSSVWAQLPTKLGYVDMEKAVNESKAGKEARDKFLKYMKKKRAESEKKKKELTSMKQILEKQGALLAEDVRVEKEREYQKKVREYQLYLKNLRDDARTKEMEMSKKIIREIQKVIFSYAKKGGYAMIFEKSRSGLLYAPDSLDLTDTIIKIYDQEYSKKKK